MVKLIFLCRRRPDIDHARYTELLLKEHVPIALKHHPMMRKYVINIVEECGRGAEELDSVGELSFPSLADFRERLYDSPEGERIVHRDVARFMGSAHAYATTEHVHKNARAPAPLGTRSPGLKLICPVKRRPDMSHQQFVTHWLQRHVPLALRHHPLIAYVTNVVDQRVSESGEDWDGIAELHFPSAAARVQFCDSPEGKRIIRADVARFVGHGIAYRVAEYVQKA